MAARDAILLAREIRALYSRTCALATRYNEGIEAEYRSFNDAFRGRPQRAVPELEHFETVFDRSAAMQTAMAQPQVRRMSSMLLFACWLLIFWINWEALAGYGSIAIAFALTALLGVLSIVAHHQLVMRSATVRRNLREQLIARGVPICLHCGYDLRGQIEPRCPECGKLALHLGLPLPRAADSHGVSCHVR
jgi:hypothetical protein